MGDNFVPRKWSNSYWSDDILMKAPSLRDNFRGEGWSLGMCFNDEDCKKFEDYVKDISSKTSKYSSGKKRLIYYLVISSTGVGDLEKEFPELFEP